MNPQPPADDRLYLVLKHQICARIFSGDYPDGANLPPERTLAESLNVSRVTVRKALALLEADGVIERVRGSGNRVRLDRASCQSPMEIIAVLAHAQNVFFAAFMDCFQRTAEDHDALVLFKQNPAGELLHDCLFKLFQKNVRNAVIWLEDQRVDQERIRRLRGLGMNLVFFDAAMPSPHADDVLVDNLDAITCLRQHLVRRGRLRIGYVGWDNPTISSVGERERIFLGLQPRPAIQRVPWAERGRLGPTAERLARQMKQAGQAPDGLVCGDGEIGVAMRKALDAQGLDAIEVVSPDEWPEARAMAMTIYRQDFETMARRTYQCLQGQNLAGWEAAVYAIKGALLPAAAGAAAPGRG